MILYRNHETPLYYQIYIHFKNLIINNEIEPYSKLPSIRALTEKHSISKTTVEKAYNQLLVEGFVQSQPKSGYYVLPIKQRNDTKSINPLIKSQETTYSNIAQPFDTFDVQDFKKALNNVLNYQSDNLYRPPNISGELELKKTILSHLTQERGIKASEDQIVIASGLQNHLLTLSKLTSNRRLGYIVPLFHHAQTIFKMLNFTLIPCDDLEDLLSKDLNFIYISPSNLYPSGDVIGFNDRIKLIDYAKQNNAFIIEDDYNYIYRHNAYQIPSIQGLSNNQNVIYIGSFTRQILPSFRLSYMILPPNLFLQYTESQKLTQTVSVLDQLSIAEFMKSGAYQKHLKKLSAFSKKQNDAMRDILSLIPENKEITFSGLQSNLHVLFHFETLKIKQEFIKMIENHWYYTVFNDWPNTILLPYHGFSKNDYESLNDYLKDCLK